MPLLAYFIFVGTILMGMMALAETAISPPLTFNTSSQILPQKSPPKSSTVRDVSPSPSKILASAKFTKKAKLTRKPKAMRTNNVARSDAKSAYRNYYMRLAQQNYGIRW
jgi:hypothetical protein